MTQVIEKIGGEYRNRTGVHGFAIRCVTTPPTRLACGEIDLAELNSGCKGCGRQGALFSCRICRCLLNLFVAVHQIRILTE
jgi:hypothetical protein